MDALSLAISGLAAATDRFTASVERTVEGSNDFTAELTEQVAAKAGFEASVVVLRSAAEASKRLLDILV